VPTLYDDEKPPCPASGGPIEDAPDSGYLLARGRYEIALDFTKWGKPMKKVELLEVNDDSLKYL
jgi:hypothetical protein